MPTLQRAKTLAKADRIQVHTEIDGLVYSVYNIVNSTSYAVYRESIDSPWICDCIWAQYHTGEAQNPCKHIAAIIAKLEREGA